MTGPGGYVPPASLVPLFTGPGAAAPPRGGELLQARLTAWNATTRENTVMLFGESRTNLPVLGPAEATLTAGVTVLLIPLGPTHIIAGRIRIPTPPTTP